MGAYLRRGGVRERIDAVLTMFPDLGKALERRAGTLSGGQRSMLAMGRGLMLDPAVLLLDEPTAGLAPEFTGEVWRQVKRVAASGTAVVVVEQNATAALQAADWAYVLVAGRNRHDDQRGRLCSPTPTWGACSWADNVPRVVGIATGDGSTSSTIGQRTGHMDVEDGAMRRCNYDISEIRGVGSAGDPAAAGGSGRQRARAAARRSAQPTAR